jgi:hypothetical protein
MLVLSVDSYYTGCIVRAKLLRPNSSPKALRSPGDNKENKCRIAARWRSKLIQKAGFTTNQQVGLPEIRIVSRLDCQMPHVFTIRRISDPTRLVAKFIASEPGDKADAERKESSSRLRFAHSPDFLLSLRR